MSEETLSESTSISISRQTRSRKRRQPRAPSVDHGIAWSNAPMNISYMRKASAPSSSTIWSRVDHIAAGLGHLLAVRAEDHAVAGALLIRFGRGHHADVVEEAVPEAGIEQVQRGVAPCRRCTSPPAASTSFPPWRPAHHRCGGRCSAGNTSSNRPTAAWCPVSRLAGAAALGAGGVHPVGHRRQRAFAVVGGHIALYLRKRQRQLFS